MSNSALSGKGPFLVVALVLVGIGVWYSAPQTKRAEAANGNAQGGDGAPLVKIEPIVVNLSDEDEVHYLKCSLELEVTTAKDGEAIVARSSAVRNELILLLSSLTSESVRGEKAKIELLNKVAQRINKVLGRDVVQHVFFTELVVQ